MPHAAAAAAADGVITVNNYTASPLYRRGHKIAFILYWMQTNYCAPFYKTGVLWSTNL